MRPNKQNIINDILIELEKGTERIDCLATVGKAWQTPTRTFDRYWKEAQNQYKIKHQLIQKQINDAEVENKKEVLKTANLTKIDRILIAEKIALGTAKKVEGTIIMPTPSDQLRALDYLGKIYGDYAITKTETELKFNKVSDVQDWILSKNK